MADSGVVVHYYPFEYPMPHAPVVARGVATRGDAAVFAAPFSGFLNTTALNAFSSSPVFAVH
jgi:hypothetical protein